MAIRGNLRISGVWHVGWWHLITSVRLIQVGNNRNDHFRYFVGVRVRLIGVCLIKVSFKANKGNKFWDFVYCLLNRGCPLNMVSALYRFHCILYFLAYNPKILDNLKTGEKVAVFETIMSNIINKYTIKAITTNTFLSKSSTPHKFLLLFAPCPRTSSHSSPSFDEKDIK